MEVKRVKVSEELVSELSEGWSKPVEVRIVGERDGDLMLVFRDAAEPTPEVSGRRAEERS